MTLDQKSNCLSNLLPKVAEEICRDEYQNRILPPYILPVSKTYYHIDLKKERYGMSKKCI